VSRRRVPRPAGAALRGALEGASPRTALAAAQTVWADACGEAIAAEARPVAERDGVVTVACRSATWAAELGLMQGELLARLNEALQEHSIEALRFTADADRWSPG
jgi:predicted nucleic acid-binding Zn ribbon protein